MVTFQDREQAAGGSHSSSGAEINSISGLEKGARRGNSKFANDIELFRAVECRGNDGELRGTL